MAAGKVVPLPPRDLGLPAALTGFMERALAVRPEDRFAGAAEMAAALGRIAGE